MPGPSFRNPPAVERVLSVQFRELAGFDLVHYGMWFERIREEFPLSKREGRLPPIIERFPALRGPALLKVDVGFPLGRCVYFSSEPSTRLQQLQPDRFAMNWRRKEGDEYARYPETSRRFADSFQMFVTFCRDAGLPEPIVELCEVTYVNHIRCPGDSDAAEFCAQVFGNGTLGTRGGGLPAPSGFLINRRFDFPEERGRLYAEAALTEDAEGEFLQLKMTGRTISSSGEPWPVRMQLAHDWIVEGFVALTQESVRKDLWEQYDE